MKVYTSFLNDFDKNEYERCFSLMRDTRKETVLRYSFEDDKTRTVLGEHLARKGISEITDIPYEAIIFERDENGKPFAKGIDLDFSISHSGEIVICAIDENRIGADVELIREINLRVTKTACTEAEKEFIFSAESEDEKVLRFFTIWTAKEAYFKYLGTGIKGLKTVEYSDLKPNIEIIREADYLISIYKK